MTIWVDSQIDCVWSGIETFFPKSFELIARFIFSRYIAGQVKSKFCFSISVVFGLFCLVEKIYFMER